MSSRVKTIKNDRDGVAMELSELARYLFRSWVQRKHPGYSGPLTVRVCPDDILAVTVDEFPGEKFSF